jgi:protocatechuate 3,4-dioxygenase beta subunit
MEKERLTRRDLMLRCAALGSLTLAPGLSVSEAIAGWEGQKTPLKPTAWDELGPFYKREAPRTTHLRKPGDPGLPITVVGKVFDVSGKALPGATLEIWQTDHRGRYDLEGYHYRALLTAGDQGQYDFDSVMPGHYPSRVCQHIHYKVKAPGHKELITQLYFATDPVFQGDPDHNYHRDPLIQSRDLVRPVMLTGDPKQITARVNFEVVLEVL